PLPVGPAVAHEVGVDGRGEALSIEAFDRDRPLQRDASERRDLADQRLHLLRRELRRRGRMLAAWRDLRGCRAPGGEEKARRNASKEPAHRGSLSFARILHPSAAPPLQPRWRSSNAYCSSLRTPSPTP